MSLARFKVLTTDVVATIVQFDAGNNSRNSASWSGTELMRAEKKREFATIEYQKIQKTAEKYLSTGAVYYTSYIYGMRDFVVSHLSPLAFAAASRTPNSFFSPPRNIIKKAWTHFVQVAAPCRDQTGKTMDLQLQPGKVTTNDRTIVAGDNTDQPVPAAMAPPVVREQAPQGGRLMMPRPDATPAMQEATAKRVRDTEPGEPGPPTKRVRTTGTSSAEQSATFPLQAETGLLAMPDDVLLLIVAAPHTPETVADVRHRQWLRACCKELQERIAAPLPGVVQDLKHQASEKNIRAVLSDTRLDGQQVQTQVRALCDRYGDVRVSLRNRAGLLSTSPNLHLRNRYALAGIGESREMRSLQLGLDGAQDVTVNSLCDALRQTAPTRVSLTVSRMKWGNGALAALLDRVSQSDAIVSVAIDGSGGASSSGFRLREQGGWGPKPVQSLRRMLQNNRSLELLDLSSMHPGDDAIEAIAQSLAVNSTLVELRLPGNELSEKGMQLLGEALDSNVGLATLKLDENRLGPRGAQGLLAGLRKTAH